MSRQITINPQEQSFIKIARDFGMTDMEIYGTDFKNHWIMK